MSKQIELGPAERVRDVRDVADVLPNVVARIGGAATAQSVPRAVERDHVATGEKRGKLVEAAGIIEPAVQGEHGQPGGVAPFACRQFKARQRELKLARCAQ